MYLDVCVYDEGRKRIESDYDYGVTMPPSMIEVQMRGGNDNDV